MERASPIRNEALRVLVAVAKHGSLSRAAAALGESKSTISRLLGELEAGVGVTLLKRTNAGVALTEAGQAMVVRANEILRLVESAVADAQVAEGRAGGDVVAVAPQLFLDRILIPALPDFFDKHPDVRLVLRSATTPAGNVDPEAHVSIYVGTMPDVDMVKKRIGRSRLKIFASPDCLHALAASGDLAALAAPDLLGAPTTGDCHRLVNAGPSGHTIRLTLDEPHLRLRAVQRGLGAAWLPEFLCRADVRSGALVEVTPDISFGPIDLHALYDAHLGRVTRVRAFVAFLKQIVGDL